MKWIVLTGYSEFSFAQDAIGLGASNYLLKPVDRAELALSLSDIELALRSQNDGMNVKFGSWMTDICHGLVMDDVTEESVEQNIQDFHMFVFYVDSGLEETMKSSRLSSFYKQMRDRIGSRLQAQSKIRFSFIFLPSGELALITGSKEPNTARLMDKVEQDMDQVMQEAVIRSWIWSDYADSAMSVLFRCEGAVGFIAAFICYADWLRDESKMAFARLGEGPR